MKKWFTTEKIDSATWAISEYGHWEESHSYLIIGSQKAALIDTGLGVADIKYVVEKITNLPIQIVITHAHWDHIGGIDKFSNIAVHSDDADWLENGLPISDEHIQSNFVSKPSSVPLPKSFKLSGYSVPRRHPSSVLSDGDVIDLGNRQLTIIHTPGHSPGSICIFEMNSGYLFTGDTIYQGTLYMNYESTDPLAFAKSVRKLDDLKGVQKVFPGHHKMPLDKEFMHKVHESFKTLHKENVLHHGSGLHAFGDHSILI